MSPYIVTTKQPITAVSLFASRGSFERDSLPVVSQRAVATLEEARTEVFDHLTATDDLAEHLGGAASRLAFSVEPGERIGPLPDGTVIEVERVKTFGDLWEMLPVGARLATDSLDRTGILDAFNEREARRTA